MQMGVLGPNGMDQKLADLRCDIQIFSQMEEITNQIYDIVVELQ